MNQEASDDTMDTNDAADTYQTLFGWDLAENEKVGAILAERGALMSMSIPGHDKHIRLRDDLMQHI